MSTSMHRLQISLPRWQVQFLTERARRNKVSLAEILRQMIERESEAAPTQASMDSLLEMAGLAEDNAPLLDDIPVSERPDLYLAALASSSATHKPRTRRSRASWPGE